MFLRSIQLRDWKAYANGQFDFPIPTKNKNVVLIGAKNGYGKTSLLEAIILGLYGRDGMHAPRAGGNLEFGRGQVLRRVHGDAPCTPKRCSRGVPRSRSRSCWRMQLSG